MMRRSTIVVVASLALLSIGINVGGQSPSADQAKIQGTWRLTEERLTGPNMATRPLSTGMWVFTGGHHMVVGENFRDKPRPDILDASRATADELRGAFVPLYARAGTYELGFDNILTERNFVTKNPQGMKPGAFQKWTYKLDGDTLSMTLHSNQDGPIANPGSWTYRRVVDSGAAQPRSASRQSFKDDSWMGVWNLNLAESEYNPDPGPFPRSVVATLKPSEGGFFKHTVDTVDAQGRATSIETIAKFDGDDYPTRGAQTGDTRSYQHITERTLEVVVKNTDRKVTIINRWMLSRDGKTLKLDNNITSTAKNAQGQTSYSTTVWDRQ